MGLLAVLLLTGVAVAGGVVGIVIALTNGRLSQPGPSEDEPGLIRVSAQVHTGWEQTLLGLHRELGLPRTLDGLPYGGLYLEPQHERQLLLRTRSEIGRGFLGAIDIAPGRGLTTVVYRILRLPGDDQVRERVLDLELQLVAALRHIDRTVQVQLTGGPLREVQPLHEEPAARPRGPRR